MCERCQIETDTVVHRLWDCETLIDFLTIFTEKEAEWTNRRGKINLRDYLFGEQNEIGRNHFWLEIKLFIFYNWKSEENIVTTCNRFKNKLKNTIILEKQMVKGDLGYEQFVNKWKDFTEIYDFRGPDIFPFL